MTIELVELAVRLCNRDGRAAAADRLGEALGGETVMVFVRDADVDALLAAPGFPQSLPSGRAWREFLEACVVHHDCRGSLSFRSRDEEMPVFGISGDDRAVLVVIGTSTPRGDLGVLRALLPALYAAFCGEETAAHAEARATLARDAARRAEQLAEALDAARAQTQRALDEARRARDELEDSNTQLQDAAAELEAQASELELQADELLSLNAGLEEARRVAEAANKSKSDFLATMSHELRTPLNAISGHTQLLSLELHGPITEAQRGALERIDRSQRHLLGLINDILNLARIEAGRVEYDIARVSLSATLTDLGPMIEPQLAAKGLCYQPCVDASAPWVLADPEKLQQVLLNLLSNAVKFTDRGGTVTVTAERDEETHTARVIVTDTGCGIPAEKLGAVFEPFVQVDSSHSRLGQGTGLGLAISRDLARGMGGELSASSTPSVGSAFTLTLRLAD